MLITISQSFDNPKTNIIESIIFDFPEPLKPVTALN